MFEQFSQLAEQAATRASRRQFLGRVGRGAMGVAAALSGLLVLPGDAQAAHGVCGPASSAICRGRPIGSRCRKSIRTFGKCIGDTAGCFCN
jgi:hypothetical protein